MGQDNPYHSAEDQRIAGRMVKTLIQYGPKKSPCATTWQEDTEYHELKRENPELFKKKISQKIAEIKRHIVTISDEDDLAECKLAIKKFEEGIKTVVVFCRIIFLKNEYSIIEITATENI